MGQTDGPVAFIDATQPATPYPSSLTVAGLGMLERTLRLAAVCGCTHATVLVSPERAETARETVTAVREDGRWEIEVDLQESTSTTSSNALEGFCRNTSGETYLYLRADHVYERQMVEQCLQRAATRGGIWSARIESGELAPILAGPPHDWQPFADDLDVEPLERLERVDGDGATSLDSELCLLEPAEGWTVSVDSASAAARAEDRIWLDCYKSVDGPISRYVNRPISLAISRRLASTDLTPNHMSVVTFLVGIAAALAVAPGGYWWFLLGAILYQLSSILDGVDGELARARYEFSLAGEWIDSISDNSKDIFFYLALGYGAWQTVPFGLGVGHPGIWMWLGGVAALGKLLSFLGYAAWMIPNGTGCPANFDWGDEATPSDDEGTWVDRTVETFKVLAKNDVVLFAAFALGVVGLLPWFLVILGIAHPVVATSIARRLYELRRGVERPTEAPADGR